MRILTSLLFLVLFIGDASNVYAQDNNKSIVKTFMWTFELPNSYSRGPVDIFVQGEYHFTKEKLGNRYLVRLHSTVTRMEFQPKFGTLRYRLDGKDYRQDQVHAADNLGSSGFNGLNITSVGFSIETQFLKNAKMGYMGDGVAYEVGDIDEHADLNKLVLNFAGSQLKNINWQGSQPLESRLNNLGKAKTTQSSSQTVNNTSGSKTNSNPQGKNSSPSLTATSTNTTSIKSKPNTGNSSTSSNNGTGNSSEYGNTGSSSNSSTTAGSATTLPVGSTYNSNPVYSTPSASPDPVVMAAASSVINTAAYFLNEAAENRERKEAEQQRAYEQATEKNNLLAENVQKTARNTFQEVINNYTRGTKSTQSKLNLVFVHNLIESNYYYYSQDARKRNHVSVKWLLPEWKQDKQWTERWIEEAALKGNVDAMLYKYGKAVTSKESVGKLEALAEKGSKDAMIILGRHYNQKRRLYGLDGIQGNDATKALYWFTKAANSGCPMGLYYLGMIYKYGYLPFDNVYNDDEDNLKYVKYTVEKDQKKAFEYFSKAAELGYYYDPSSYAKFESLDGYLKKKNAWPSGELDYGSSYFHPNTFTELALFYIEGKVVPKNESKAQEYTKQAVAYTNANLSGDFAEHIKYAFRYHDAEWPEINNEIALCYNTDSLPGKYVIESRKEGNYITTVPILDLKEDFYISFRVTKVNWPNTSAYGIVLGEDPTSKNHFLLNVTGSEYVFADKGKAYTEIQKTNIDQQSGRIGANLRANGQFLEITALQPGYPAMNSNQIAIGDVILKIAQENDGPVDMIGKSVAEALEKIKGKDGTEVRLTIKKNDGAIKVVSLIRKASSTTDWSIHKEKNKLSIDIGGQTVLKDKEIKELYGKGFGFMIHSDANPARIEIEDFRFHVIY